jgi:hypothetical protein
MSLTQAKAEELIALTTKLAALIEQDVATLKAKRPAALPQDESRAGLLALYGKAAAEFKTAASVASLPAAMKQRLKAATERLHKALKEETRLLARFRHVTEGLVKAIAERVTARQAAPTYAKAGTVVKPPAAPRATALTLNKSV